ncbi:ABC transporter ATP-binding protein [Pseudodesulfovibrio portus]|uniref:Spermidine/putrescine import ATP-binding protein PotA n=1 Tax=Pseudodesulfovibrio portus TaxID=231439 RepID=A0ABM8AT88_9BACT|nr:ABC transporter ATP-binding protein [Pseudodesulfovibrio portus]BDQ34679.1 spermidine/putrescine import ATP-binding protein PotA [Pseudodesulfovibrio portus]
MNNDLSIRNMVKRFGDFTAVDDVTFDVPEGSFFSILGPSGCGKTTLLRMIAGFEEPTSGDIEIRGQNMLGVPPNLRPVNLVFQHLALFPMMNVAENIGFGLKRRGMGNKEIRSRTEAILERVDLPDFGEKQINQLSGGQKQRVAIARCLVLEPSVLLLDEPLGALDLKLREQMKVELKKLQTTVGTTFVYITHDQSEALVMSDQVAVMNHGRFEQLGTPQELYGQPETPFVAQFVGDNNIWHGTVSQSLEGLVLITTDEGYSFQTKTNAPLKDGVKADLFLRPEAMIIEPKNTVGLNIFSVIVKSILFDGANSRLLTTTKEDHELIVTLPQNRKFDYIEPGNEISVGWHPESGICFASED